MILLFSYMAVLSGQEPVFRLRDLDDQWKEYADLKGDQLTVIDFWATWCQPCVRSIPLLNQMSVELKSKGVNFFGVSIDGPRNQAKVKPFIQSMGVTYPIIRDIDSELMKELSVSAVPTLVVYDAEGEQVYFHEGFRPGDEELIRNHIEELLDE